MVSGIGIGDWGFGIGVQGSGFRVQGSGFRDQGPGFRIQGSGFRIQGSGFRVQGSGFRVQGSEFRIERCGRNLEGHPHDEGHEVHEAEGNSLRRTTPQPDGVDSLGVLIADETSDLGKNIRQ